MQPIWHAPAGHKLPWVAWPQGALGTLAGPCLGSEGKGGDRPAPGPSPRLRAVLTPGRASLALRRGRGASALPPPSPPPLLCGEVKGCPQGPLDPCTGCPAGGQCPQRRVASEFSWRMASSTPEHHPSGLPLTPGYGLTPGLTVCGKQTQSLPAGVPLGGCVPTRSLPRDPPSEVLCLPHLTDEEHELLPSCQEAQGHLVQVGTWHNKPPRGLGQRGETGECLDHKRQAGNSQPMARLCPGPSPALLACFLFP